MSRIVVSAAAAGHASSPLLNVITQSPVAMRPGMDDGTVEPRLDRRAILVGDYGTMNNSNQGEGIISSRRMNTEGSSISDEAGRSDILDEEFEDVRLTPESYKRTVLLYSLVPITSLLTILFFILLKWFVWPLPIASGSHKTYLILAFVGAAIWTISFSLRIPLYLFSTYVCGSFPILIPLLSTFLQVFFEEAFRILSIIIAHIHVQAHVNARDPSFSYVWTLTLGWATAEVAVSIAQGYAQLALYRDVAARDAEQALSNVWTEEQSTLLTLGDSGYQLEPEASRVHSNDRLCARAELESLYGVPVPEIPVFVSSLLRIDSILLSLALFLIISHSYLAYLSTLPFAADHPIEAVQRTLPMFLGIVTLHTLLGFAWTPDILPRIGLHAASYISCMVALGTFFVGLAMWEAI